MVIVINYGDDTLKLELPDHISFDEYAPDTRDGAVNFESFDSAVSSAEKQIFDVSEADLFILNDAYRRTPSAKLLRWLSGMGRLNDRAKFLIATGCHAPPDEQQLETIFGTLYRELAQRVIVHDAENPECLAQVGRDSTGEPVFLNRAFLEAEKVIIIGSVEPHYFAGFTGGRKSIFPGLCDFDTTVRNHNLAVKFTAAPMKLEGNPVAEHLQSLMKLISNKKILGIQLVTGSGMKIRAVFCGSLEESFRKAGELSARIFENRIKEKYDLLLAEARPPLDSNLYQLQKSLENSQQAVSDEGTILLLSPCHEGIGLDSFYRLAEDWNPDDSLIEGRRSFGRHKLYRVYRIGQRIKVHLYSELPDGAPDRVFFRTAREPQKIINRLTEDNSRLRVALVRDSGHTVLTNNCHLIS